MKIINETCYNTEDIKHLLLRVQIAQKKTNERVKPTYTGVHYKPETLLISYWTRTREYGPKFINGSVDHTIGKLGIVRPGNLGIAPLVALAQAADGSELRLPADVTKEMVDYFRSWVAFYYRYNVTPQEDFSWVSSYEVRYSARAKSGQKLLGKLIRAEVSYKNLLEREARSPFADLIKVAENDIYYAEQTLNEKKDLLASRKRRQKEHYEKIAKYEDKIAQLKADIAEKNPDIKPSPGRVEDKETAGDGNS